MARYASGSREGCLSDEDPYGASSILSAGGQVFGSQPHLAAIFSQAGSLVDPHRVDGNIFAKDIGQTAKASYHKNSNCILNSASRTKFLPSLEGKCYNHYLGRCPCRPSGTNRWVRLLLGQNKVLVMAQCPGICRLKECLTAWLAASGPAPQRQ